MIMETVGLIVAVIGITYLLMCVEQLYYTYIELFEGTVIGKEYLQYGEWSITVERGSRREIAIAQQVNAGKVDIGETTTIVLTRGKFSGMVYDAVLE